MRIFLIGFDEGFARSLTRYVSSVNSVALVGAAPSLALAGIMLPNTRAALALVDWSVLGAFPRERFQALRFCHPGLRIVCVADEAAAYRTASLAAGADAVISKNSFAEEFELLLRGFQSAHGTVHGDHHA